MKNNARRKFIAAGAQAALAASMPFMSARGQESPADPRASFRRIRTQFIAALADPDARSGTDAQSWGLWELDPGPRGVALAAWERIRQNGGIAPAGWHFDESSWWLEEHGLIMEAPQFPLAPGEYLVTGDRAAVSVLTIQPPDNAGRQAWSLSNDASIYDVTHLRCRSARYTPAAGTGTCAPVQARQSDFPVRPGAPMPPVTDCQKQDYAVLLVIGLPGNT